MLYRDLPHWARCAGGTRDIHRRAARAGQLWYSAADAALEFFRTPAAAQRAGGDWVAVTLSPRALTAPEAAERGWERARRLE